MTVTYFAHLVCGSFCTERCSSQCLPTVCKKLNCPSNLFSSPFVILLSFSSKRLLTRFSDSNLLFFQSIVIAIWVVLNGNDLLYWRQCCYEKEEHKFLLAQLQLTCKEKDPTCLRRTFGGKFWCSYLHQHLTSCCKVSPMNSAVWKEAPKPDQENSCCFLWIFFGQCRRWYSLEGRLLHRCKLFLSHNWSFWWACH